MKGLEVSGAYTGQERRVLPDRRAQPTTFWSALRWHGRRRSFRRGGEGRNAYVNCPQSRTVALVLLVVGGSTLDAWLTLCHLADGGQEANPAMALAIAAGPSVFFSVKMGLTGFGAWVLAVHQQFALALQGLYGLTLGYGLLLLYHGLLMVW